MFDEEKRQQEVIDFTSNKKTRLERDDDINQQADYIESLEKKNSELSRALSVAGDRISELDAKGRAWSAQNDHINQQANIIESLEKKNSELGKEFGKAWKRIDELELIATDYATKFQITQDRLKHQALLHKSQLESLEIQSIHYQENSRAVRSVIAERQRQITVEGWTPDHDDEHGDDELALAAACYLVNFATFTGLRDGQVVEWADAPQPANWPWEPSWWKPASPRADLVKAAAMIIAEIERGDRRYEMSLPDDPGVN